MNIINCLYIQAFVGGQSTTSSTQDFSKFGGYEQVRQFQEISTCCFGGVPVLLKILWTYIFKNKNKKNYNQESNVLFYHRVHRKFFILIWQEPIQELFDVIFSYIRN